MTMTTGPLTALYDNWTRPNYERRVRPIRTVSGLTITVSGPTFLWGSAGITQNLSSEKPLVLHIRNNTFGQDNHPRNSSHLDNAGADANPLRNVAAGRMYLHTPAGSIRGLRHL